MLNTTHSLPWNNEYIIKNISFYSHKAESFAVYIYPRIRIQSAARTVPSDFTGKLDRGVCLGSFPRSSVCVQNWLKTQFFSSDTPLLPASCIAPSISLPATDIKMFCCFITWRLSFHGILSLLSYKRCCNIYLTTSLTVSGTYWLCCAFYSFKTSFYFPLVHGYHNLLLFT